MRSLPYPLALKELMSFGNCPRLISPTGYVDRSKDFNVPPPHPVDVHPSTLMYLPIENPILPRDKETVEAMGPPIHLELLTSLPPVPSSRMRPVLGMPDTVLA